MTRTPELRLLWLGVSRGSRCTPPARAPFSEAGRPGTDLHRLSTITARPVTGFVSSRIPLLLLTLPICLTGPWDDRPTLKGMSEGGKIWRLMGELTACVLLETPTARAVSTRLPPTSTSHAGAGLLP